MAFGPRDIRYLELRDSLAKFRTAIAQEEHIYVWGWVAYDDIFEDSARHLTEFCQEVRFESLSDELVRWTAVSCPLPNNCYDEDCPDYEERIQERPQ